MYSSSDYFVPPTQQSIVPQEDGSLEGKTVKEVMDTWTVQMGYPVININRYESTSPLFFFDPWALAILSEIQTEMQVLRRLKIGHCKTRQVRKVKLKLCSTKPGSSSIHQTEPTRRMSTTTNGENLLSLSCNFSHLSKVGAPLIHNCGKWI